MATARDRINRSLRLLGILAQGETASASQLSDAIVALNGMLGVWSADGLYVPNILREEFTLVNGTAAYTLGASGATFTSARPVAIHEARLEIQGSSPYETPMDIINVQQWANISDKAVQSSIPTTLYVEWTYPNLTLNIWPVPSEANRLVLYCEKPLSTLTAESTVSMPPGYDDAIDYNLAVRLAPEYSRAVPAEVAMGAQESSTSIQRKNLKPSLLGVDAALLGPGRYNIMTGQYS